MTDRFFTVRTHSPKTVRAAALALAMLCGSALSSTQAVAEEQPVKGGEITIINGSDIKSWDPAITNSTFPGGPMDMLDAIYGFIVYVDVKGVVQGGMAESLTSSDAKVWTLKLRPNVKFTDGAAYDAEAVKFNWDRVADPATLSPAQVFVSGWNKSIKIVDPLTIEITLATPDRNFGSTLANLSPFIASPAALKAAEKKTDIKPVGAGAFVLENWNQGVSMTLKRNPGYWDQPRPYLDTLKFVVIPETNSRISTVVQGGATMMAGYMYQFGSNATAEGVTTHEIPLSGLYRAYFNQARGVFTDHRAREAFYEALQRPRLMKAYTQIDGYVMPTNYFTADSPYYDATYKLPEYNPEHAQELFDALAKDGKPFDIKIVTYSNSDLKRMGSYLQQSLSAYENVKVDLQLVDQAMLSPTCKVQGNFDLCIDGGVLVANGAEPIISNLLSSKGNDNWGKYNSPDMDRALAAANATMDPEAVKKAYADVQKLVVQDLPLYIFGSESRNLLIRNNTGGIVPSNGGILQKQFLFVCKDACTTK
ncbi:ABC transporter substrate-binding protein [Agrobacterium tumefaciens]|uniref:ABC transporter substrate-binding protein n=1 Tax=Agrobacterium tumefaciens TaxID=358 RepID=UPI00287C9F33|nr:ABC transporter substrate-binding protein [Agrobacterium tumefaciens]MDS7594273.1 ABC transporter substrate-binding protein [Agrobacterium tumefaciens]